MDNWLSIRIISVITLLALSYNLCNAEQIIRLTPTEDTYCVNNATVHGLEATMQVGHSQYGEWQRKAYLKFDISSVPSEVDSVVVRIFTDGWSAGGSREHNFRLFPVARNDWAEDDVSYNNASTKLGAQITSPVLAEVVPAGSGEAFSAGWVEWKGSELNKYVEDSAQAARPYLSLRLSETYIVKNANSGVIVRFHSKENTSGFAPEMIVYAPDSAKPVDPDTIPVVHDSTEARLSAILLDGEPLEFFDKDSFSYVVPLPYTAISEPVITAMCLDTVARYVVNGNSITVTSADGQHQQTYTLAFQVLPKMDLFLAIGQSNMAGRAPYDDVAEPLENVYLLTPNGSMEIASNPMNKHSNVRKDISVQGQGPHYQFALSMRDSLPDRTVGMVVNAQGGTSITIWYKPGTTNYDLTIARAKKAQKWGEYKGIIWHQGESDVTDGLSNNYATYKSRLQTMVSSLRTDLGCDTLWFIAGELSLKETHQTFNEVVIQQIASYISNADFVVSTGTSLLSDNTHFDEPSVQLMGLRYAEKILKHVYPVKKITALDQQPCLPNAEKILSNGQMYIVVNNKKISLLGQTIY